MEALNEPLPDADPQKNFKQNTLGILKEWNIAKKLF